MDASKRPLQLKTEMSVTINSKVVWLIIVFEVSSLVAAG